MSGPECGSPAEDSAQGLAWLLSHCIFTQMLGPQCLPVHPGRVFLPEMLEQSHSRPPFLLPTVERVGSQGVFHNFPPPPCPPSPSTKVVPSECAASFLNGSQGLEDAPRPSHPSGQSGAVPLFSKGYAQACCPLPGNILLPPL